MKKLIILFVGVLASCGRAYDPCLSDTFISGGLEVCHNNLPISPGDIELGVNLLQKAINIYYPDITNIEDTFEQEIVKVIFLDAYLSYSCIDIDSGVNICSQHIGGIAIDGAKTLYVQYKPCLGNSSFQHELMHSVEKFYLGNGDPTHSTEHFFIQKSSNPRSTIEYIANTNLRGLAESCKN